MRANHVALLPSTSFFFIILAVGWFASSCYYKKKPRTRAKARARTKEEPCITCLQVFELAINPKTVSKEAKTALTMSG
jgi:hypothetical protein